MSIHAYYERYWTSEGFNPESSESSDLLDLFTVHVEPHFDCLDIGCGDGRKSGLWLSTHAASYIGVDISTEAVRKTQDLGLEALKVEDAGALPFPDASFHFTACAEVLEHLFAPLEAALEAHRVLRPGGLLLVTVPNIGYWRRRIDMLFGRWNPLGDTLAVREPWRDPHIRFFTVRSLKAMLERADFEPVKISGHKGCFMGDLPLFRRMFGAPTASSTYRWLEALAPSLLGYRLTALAVKGGRACETSSSSSLIPSARPQDGCCGS